MLSVFGSTSLSKNFVLASLAETTFELFKLRDGLSPLR